MLRPQHLTTTRPGMDGQDCFKEIIKQHPPQKAIMASGCLETHCVRALQNLSAGAYLKRTLYHG